MYTWSGNVRHRWRVADERPEMDIWTARETRANELRRN